MVAGRGGAGAMKLYHANSELVLRPTSNPLYLAFPGDDADGVWFEKSSASYFYARNFVLRIW